MSEPFLRVGAVEPGIRQAWRAAGLTVLDGFGSRVSRWSLERHVCVGHIGDHTALADAVEAADRGACLAVTVSDALADALFDDAARAGLRAGDGPTPSGDGGSVSRFVAVRARPDPPADPRPEWVVLLELLADGTSVAQAARSCHISLRSAYRRLETARTTLGVASTTAAVVEWRSRSR
ncbi:MAG: hypothetical protein WKF57_19100 [Nakamurella sp.]